MDLPKSQTIAIDPGVRGCGVGIINDGTMARAWYLKTGAPKTATTLEAAASMARVLCATLTLEREHWLWALNCRRILCEMPRAYPPARGRRNVDPNDLMALSVVVGGAAACGARLVTPREWKGTVNGDVFLDIVRAGMLPEEWANVESPGKTLEHNVLDAVGLGFWAVGRLKQTRVVDRR